MKNLLLIPFFFLFFQKINGQNEPRLVKKVFEQYSDSLDLYLSQKQELFEYDFFGNVTSESQIDYDEEGEIISWTGVVKEYNTDHLLTKTTNRRYNWDVVIWITIDWVEFIYDENDCLIERIVVPNSVLDPKSTQTLELDNDCRELGYHSVTEDGDTFGKSEMAYDNRGNIIFIQDYFYIDIFDSLFLSRGVLQQFNEQNDKVDFFDYFLWGSGHLFDYTHELYEYEYRFDINDRLDNKLQTTYQVVYSNNYNIHNPTLPIDTFLSEIATVEYQYCKDVLIKEEVSFEEFDSDGNSFLGNRRVLYFYEGENACFDFENKSTASIYPNPTSSFVQIESPLFGSGNTQVQVIGVGGKVLLERLIFSREEKQELDLSRFLNGTYIIQLRNGEHFISKKIVVIK